MFLSTRYPYIHPCDLFISTNVPKDKKFSVLNTLSFQVFQHLVLAVVIKNRQNGCNLNEIQYWIPLWLPLSSPKSQYSLKKKPFIFSQIQYLLLNTIPLNTIMRVSGKHFPELGLGSNFYLANGALLRKTFINRSNRYWTNLFMSVI